MDLRDFLIISAYGDVIEARNAVLLHKSDLDGEAATLIDEGSDSDRVEIANSVGVPLQDFFPFPT